MGQFDNLFLKVSNKLPYQSRDFITKNAHANSENKEAKKGVKEKPLTKEEALVLCQKIRQVGITHQNAIKEILEIKENDNQAFDLLTLPPEKQRKIERYVNSVDQPPPPDLTNQMKAAMQCIGQLTSRNPQQVLAPQQMAIVQALQRMATMNRSNLTQ